MNSKQKNTSLCCEEKLIFDYSKNTQQQKNIYESTALRVDSYKDLPASMQRSKPANLPFLSEPEVVRHFTRLSSLNYSVDHGIYPLGSCTMKYNPRINEWASRIYEFTNLHPYTPSSFCQGALALMYQLENMLAQLSGMKAVSLQPAAGAHGELTALLTIRAALKKRGNPRKYVLIPDTAHGTNPSTATLCGYSTIVVNSDSRGMLCAEKVKELMTQDVAAIMITNPNTLGIFEKDIKKICNIVHEKGGFVFGDGANFNAIMGKSRPGDYGVDAMHFNLHKTFSTPHGGGGPGSGPVGVCTQLEPFLPIPRIELTKEGYCLTTDRPLSIGRVRSFMGNFGVMIKAYTYIRELGFEGLKKVSEMAVLNANYLLALLRDNYEIPYGDNKCMHEVVLSDQAIKNQTGISALDIAKGLIDEGFHPPTVYFPLLVKGALMCEPTETESKDTIESFAQAMNEIAQCAKENPNSLKNSPQNTRLGRLDEAQAARKPVLKAAQ